MKALHWTAAVVLTVLVSAGAGAISTPQLMKIQGSLSDQTGGTPVPANGAFSMTFTLFDDELGGMDLATETQSVTVVDGFYEVNLAFAASAFDGPTTDRYIEIEVEDEVLSPRLRVVSAPYAYTAEKLDGKDSTDLDQSAEVAAVQTQFDDHGTVGDPHMQYVRKAGDTMSGSLFVERRRDDPRRCGRQRRCLLAQDRGRVVQSVPRGSAYRQRREHLAHRG